jgi:hypothetical protein
MVDRFPSHGLRGKGCQESTRLAHHYSLFPVPYSLFPVAGRRFGTRHDVAWDVVVTSRPSAFALRPKAAFWRRVDFSTSRN